MEPINKILHYIQQHFNEPLNLNSLAAQANYSPFHFHRLFKQQVGEAPKQYILRLRLERAAKDLFFYPDKTVYEIAKDTGFSSQAVFARAFKAKYAVSAETYRANELLAVTLKNEQAHVMNEPPPFSFEQMPRFEIAYETVVMQSEAAIMQGFRQIYQWAAARDLVTGNPGFYGVYFDSPINTEYSKCRYLCGIKVNTSNPAFREKIYALGGAKHAQIELSGDFSTVLDYALYFKKKQLDETGYTLVRDVRGFEYFPSFDFSKPYSEQFRILCIAVKPK